MQYAAYPLAPTSAQSLAQLMMLPLPRASMAGSTAFVIAHTAVRFTSSTASHVSADVPATEPA
jgi:hypothetical protein